MQYRYIRIRPISVFPELDSIKLFGAIFSAISELYPEKLEKFQENTEKGHVRFSSAFPVLGDTYFFPKPFLCFKNDSIDESNREKMIKNYRYLKKFKDVTFASKDIFEQIIEKGSYDEDLLNRFRKENEIKGNYLISKKEKVPEIETIEEPKVTSNRFSQETKIFYKEGVYYKNADLYFFVKANEENHKMIIAAIKFLEDRGFGAKHSLGFGQFTFIEESTMELNNDGERQLILSKYMPTDEENSFIEWNNSFYQVKEIKGLTKSGFHIPPTHIFIEGSCFASDSIKGKLEKKIPNYILNGIVYAIKVK